MRCSNDTPNLNIHKYTNYNIIETYINRLSTTMQIFIAMDYLITMSEKYLYFRKIKKHLARTFLPNWNDSGRIKVDHFRQSVSF